MSKLSRNCLIAVAIIISFIIGTYVGYVVSNDQVFAEDVIVMSKQYQFIEIARAEGSDDLYKEALLGFLDLLESLKSKRKRSPLFTERVLATDIALTHARLAILSEDNGDINGKTNHLNLAESYCPETGIIDCTSEKIVEMVKQLDN